MAQRSLMSFALAAGLAVCGALAATQAAQAADLVVVASTAPGIAPGQIVQHDAALTVPAGTSITVIAENGQSKTITGPHTGVLGIGGAGGHGSVVASLSNLFQPSGKDAMSLGVMRAAPPPPPRDPWVINTGRNGDHCVPQNGPVILWRAKAARSQVLVVKAKDGSQAEGRSEWSKGAEVTAWPQSAPVTDGAPYLLRSEDGAIARRIVLHTVPATLATDAHRAAWMANHGCAQQAKTLLATIR